MTLRVDTLANKAGTGPTDLTGQAAAKAWWNFDGTAGTPTFRASLNSSSITDAGPGQYEANLTNAMANTDFAGLHGSANLNNWSVCTSKSDTTGSGTTTSSVGMFVSATGAFVVADADEVSGSVLGDLA